MFDARTLSVLLPSSGGGGVRREGGSGIDLPSSSLWLSLHVLKFSPASKKDDRTVVDRGSKLAKPD